jgi:hypothetical protein
VVLGGVDDAQEEQEVDQEGSEEEGVVDAK